MFPGLLYLGVSNDADMRSLCWKGRRSAGPLDLEPAGELGGCNCSIAVRQRDVSGCAGEGFINETTIRPTIAAMNVIQNPSM